jgi:membrane protease YdiL (CAAX protease family)
MLEKAADDTPQVCWPSRGTWLVLALVVTLAARAIPTWYVLERIWKHQLGGEARLSYALFHDLVLLTLGLGLALSAPSLSGLRVGAVREHWRGVLFVCSVPILLTAIVYPNLPERPFAERSWSMWAISPLAQDLVFMAFLYGQLERTFPGCVHPRMALSWALILTAMFFALWHVPDFFSDISGGYVAFQLIYTALGFVLVGLSRQWTRSVLYATITHAAVNAIVWSTR